MKSRQSLGRAEPKGSVTTASGLSIQPVYGPEESERPGKFPFTRGIHDDMYRGKLWTMRQYAGFGSAKETNERYRLLLDEGSSGLSVAFDLPTQMGRDPDHPLSSGEVGKVGVSIASVDDMRVLLDKIPLEEVSISMTINSTATILLAFLLVVAEEKGVSWSTLRGTIQNDILKEYIARGTYIYPPSGAMRLITDTFAFCDREVPNWNTISVSGYHIREAGSTAVQELAFTFANAVCYVEHALRAGLEINSFSKRIAFFFNCHNDFLEEVAKFRAARRIWAKIMKDRFGATDERAMKLRFHTQTAGSSLTAQQPFNNVVRTTLQAFAAVCGGTQSLHTNGYDEALGLPTEESATLALRTQQVIAKESGIPSAADPLGGSWLIEEWTDRLESETMSELDRIDALGGMLQAIEAGVPQEAIERSAYEFQRQIEIGDSEVVGVNCYQEHNHHSAIPVLKIDSSIEEAQIKRIQAFRNDRDEKTLQAALDTLKGSAKEGGELAPTSNLLPKILDCVRAKATLGEMSDILREVFGEYHL